MGVVFEARDTVLERNVAIKLLPRSVAAQPDSLKRFLREARAAAKLHHPHVVAVYDADHFNGQYYIVLELVRGGSLQEVLKTGPLPWTEASRVLADACRGLEVAHRAGLVHRDIKPSNLMRSEDGTVKLSDFGLARPNEPTGATMTGSGSVLGTPQFMSPEQCRSERANERSDLYAMGATYYALLTSQPPYPGDAPLLVMNSHLLDPIPDPRDLDASIPAACSAIIRRAMAKDPDHRYANAAELIADLDELVACAGTGDADTALSPSLRLEHSVTAAAAISATTTEPGSFVRKLELRLGQETSQKMPTRETRSFKLIATASLLIAVAIGWLKFSAASRTDLPTTAAVLIAGDVAARQPAVATTTRPNPVGTVSSGSFRLPGMTRDLQLSSSKHEVWSMDCPSISRVALANSGEFLALLTNSSPATEKMWRGQITVWNRDGTTLLVEEIQGRASSFAISSDSTRLAVGTTGGQGVLLWDTNNWSIKWSTAAAVPDNVEAVALSPDGHWLAYTVAKSSKNGEWVLWNVSEQKELQRRVVNGSGNLRAIEFVPDDDLLVATGSSDSVVRFWKGTQAEPVSRTFHAGQPIYAIASRPEGHLLAIGAGKRFALWDSQRNVRTFVKDQLPVQVDDVAFSPNGRLIAVSSGALVEIIDADTGRPVESLTGFGARVLSMAYTPDGSELFTVSANGKLRLWRLASRSESH